MCFRSVTALWERSYPGSMVHLDEEPMDPPQKMLLKHLNRLGHWGSHRWLPLSWYQRPQESLSAEQTYHEIAKHLSSCWGRHFRLCSCPICRSMAAMCRCCQRSDQGSRIERSRYCVFRWHQIREKRLIVPISIVSKRVCRFCIVQEQTVVAIAPDGLSLSVRAGDMRA